MDSQIKKEIEEELAKLFEKIKDKTIIVEGKRDQKALYSFGLTKVYTIDKGLYELSEKFENKKIIILTDFDKEGKELSKRLSLFLQVKNKIDRETRRKVGLLLSKLYIKTIEELNH